MTILDRVLDELNRATGPVSSSKLASRVGVERSALDGMLATLVATGALVGDSSSNDDVVACGSATSCGMTCTGVDLCPLVVSAPQTLALPTIR